MNNMIIKDPYLHSQPKEPLYAPPPPPPLHPSSFALPNHNISTHSQPVYPEPMRNRAVSSGEVFQLQGRVKAYEKELRNMEHAYVRQEEAARKMLSYNEVNRQYHEAMRARNFQLNTRLREAVGEMQLVQQRSTQDQDMLLRKYEEQNEDYLRLRASYNSLLQQKTRLEEQVSHLSFLLQKEAHQFQLEAKEQALRLESMDRTYKALVSAKEEEVAQLTMRLRSYEDQNRKLMDINRTLQLTKERPLDNISQINPLDSNLKSRTHLKERQKQNQDANIPHHTNQKTINDQLRNEIDNLKKQLKEITLKNTFLEQQRRNQRNKMEGQQSSSKVKQRRESEGDLLQTSKWQGLMASVMSIRDGLNKQIFEVFFKSIKQGQRRKQNSLVIFIENWRALQMERLQPYIKSYFQVRDSLKAVAEFKQARESIHFPKMQEVIPLQLGSRSRSNINQWILSTIQFTKNQKQSSKKCFNNYLLFLFRLLTIQYRIKYPMQGKSYSLDQDVTNELMHEIIKAVNAIFQYS